MTLLKCDACKEEIAYTDAERIKYQVKRWWSGWGDSGWTKLDICKDCFAGLKCIGKLERFVEQGKNA